MDDISALKSKRFLYLKTLYTKSECNEYVTFNMFDVGRLLKYKEEITENIAQYLNAQGLIKFMGGREISITHQGVIEVENALSNPDEPTTYFPPINIINVQNMSNSQIQQGNINSSQVVNLSIENKNNIKDFLELLKQRKDELKLSDNVDSELKAEISTVEAQLGSSKPKRHILKESLFSIKNILEGASGSIIAVELLKYLPALLALL